MERLWLDTETSSPVPIRYGLHAYSEQVQVLVFAYAIDDGPVAVWDVVSGVPMPADLASALADESVEVWAHNAQFDRTMLREALGVDPALERWRCSMCLAYMHSMPGSLDALCGALGVDDDKRKLKTGKDLMRLFCIPPAANLKRGWATRETHPKEWQEFLEYAGMDIVAMRACVAKLPKWNLTESELDLWRLDRVINERGVAVDLEFCRAAVEVSDIEKARLAARAGVVTDGAVKSATQRDALLAHILSQYGVTLPDMQSSTLERRMEDPDLPEPVRELLAIRLQASSTSVSKYRAFINSTSSDGRLRGTLQFGGAARTNRWAGRLVQLQNLSRVPKYLKGQYDFAIQTIKDGNTDLVFDNVMEVVGSTVRGALIASPGKKFCRADLSNIEGRVLAWLAGEDWKVEAFARGDDLYVEGYSRSFGVPIDEVLEDEAAGGTMRLIGKVQELACISAGQLVLTDTGLIPIEHVTTRMRVWDGVAWVAHEGVVCRGTKEVIEYDGLTATEDHEVWVEGEQRPVPFGLAAASGSRLVQSGAGRHAVRVAGGHEPGAQVHKGVEWPVRAGEVHRVLHGEVGSVFKHEAGEDPGLPVVHQAPGDPEVARAQVRRGQAEVHQPQGRGVPYLWRSRRAVQVQLGDSGGVVDGGELRPTGSSDGDRPEEQRRSLRAWEPALGVETAQQVKYEPHGLARVEPGGVAVCQDAHDPHAVGGDDSGRNTCTSVAGGGRKAQELARHKGQARVFDIINAGPRNRFTVSDCLVHNCGYQGAVGAFGSMAKIYGVDLEEDRILEIVKAWRKANPMIVSFWWELGDAATEAVRNPGVTITCRKLKVRRDGNWLRIRIPSGRVLCYPSPKWEPKTFFDGVKEVENPMGGLSYVGMDQYTRKWQRIRTYSGRLVENVVQATARDVFAEGLKLCEASGYPVVLHIHDEAICETPDTAEFSGDEVARMLATNPMWAGGLPLAAEGSETKRYRK